LPSLRAIVPQHRAANDRNWRRTLFHKLVVKLFEAEGNSGLTFVVGAKLQNLQFAQGVNQVRRVRGSALGLALGDS
jgi:hypothetical protein